MHGPMTAKHWQTRALHPLANAIMMTTMALQQPVLPDTVSLRASGTGGTAVPRTGRAYFFFYFFFFF